MYIPYLSKTCATMREVADALKAKSGKLAQPYYYVSELYDDRFHDQVANLIYCLDDIYMLAKIIYPSQNNNIVLRNTLERLLCDAKVLNQLNVNLSRTIMSKHLSFVPLEIVTEVLLTHPHAIPCFINSVEQAIDIFSEMICKKNPKAKAVLLDLYRSPLFKLLFLNMNEFLNRIYSNISPSHQNLVLELVNASNLLDQNINNIEKDLMSTSVATKPSSEEVDDMISWLNAPIAKPGLR